MLLLPRGLFVTVVVVRRKIVSVNVEKTQPGPQIALKWKDFGWAESVALGKCSTCVNQVCVTGPE